MEMKMMNALYKDKRGSVLGFLFGLVVLMLLVGVVLYFKAPDILSRLPGSGIIVWIMHAIGK